MPPDGGLVDELQAENKAAPPKATATTPPIRIRDLREVVFIAGKFSIRGTEYYRIGIREKTAQAGVTNNSYKSPGEGLFSEVPFRHFRFGVTFTLSKNVSAPGEPGVIPKA